MQMACLLTRHISDFIPYACFPLWKTSIENKLQGHECGLSSELFNNNNNNNNFELWSF